MHGHDRGVNYVSLNGLIGIRSSIRENILRRPIRLASVGAAVLVAATLFASPAFASTQSSQNPVFVQTDNLSGNSIVAYDAADNGTLTKAGTYATGGLGGALGGSVTDHLASQGSLSFDSGHNLLYAVNAGSNTISVFSVSGDKLTLNQVISSGGDFPVSITVFGGFVYVLNARSGGSLQGYVVDGTKLDLVSAWHRNLGLNTGGSPEFVNTPGQVLFTFNGLGLVVTTKNASNALDIFGVDSSGDLTATPAVDSLPGTIPFSAAFDFTGRLVVAEAGANAIGTFLINSDGTLTTISRATTGESLSCWVVEDGDADYVSNNGSGVVSGFFDNQDGALSSLGNTGTDAGTEDPAVSADGHFIYVQTGATGTVDEFSVNSSNGSLTRIGSVTVPGGAGGEGIAIG